MINTVTHTDKTHTRKYAWRVGVNSTSRAPYFVCRDLPRANEHGMLIEYLENEQGNLRTFGSGNYAGAQREADRLNAVEATHS